MRRNLGTNWTGRRSQLLKYLYSLAGGWNQSILDLFKLSPNKYLFAIIMGPAPLTSFCDGCSLKVCLVSGCAEERLRDLGIREGAHVEVVRNSEELIVRIEGCRIGLRRDMATDILAIPTDL